MSDVNVSVRDNGPLLITGACKVADQDGNEFDTAGKETIALCRCGASKNRPFCDGAHKDARFVAEDRATSGDAS